MNFLDINEAKTASEAAVLLFQVGFTPIKVVGKNPAFGEGEGWQTRKYQNEDEVRKHFNKWDGEQEVDEPVVEDGKTIYKKIMRHRNVGVLCNGFCFFGPNTQKGLGALMAAIPDYEETLNRVGNNPYNCAIFKRADTEKEFWTGQKILTEGTTPFTLADIWGNRTQFVAWGLHPSGKPYRFTNNKPILSKTTDELKSYLNKAMTLLGNGYRLKIQERTAKSNKEIRACGDIFARVKQAVKMKTLLGVVDDRILCPIHKQTTQNPSAVIYQDLDGDYLHCHSSGCGGDVIAINAQINGYSQLESALDLATRFNVDINDLTWATKRNDVIALRALRQNGELAQEAQEVANPIVNVIYDEVPELAQEAQEAQNNSAQQNEAQAKPPLRGVALRASVPQAGREIHVLKLSVLEASSAQETRWILPNFLPVGSYTIMSATTASMKSWVALHAALCMATGTKGAFEPQEPTKVLYIDMENGEAEVHRRVAGLKAGMFPNGQPEILEKNLEFVFFPHLNLAQEGDDDILSELVAQIGAKVVIIDTLRRISSGEENDSGNSNMIKLAFERTIQRTGCAFLVLHHHKKTSDKPLSDEVDAVRGSSDFIQAAMCLHQLKIDRNQPSSEKKVFTLKPLKTRCAPELPSLQFSISGTAPAPVLIENMGPVDDVVVANNEAANGLREWFYEQSGNVITTAQIKQAGKKLGYGNRSIDTAIQLYSDNGILERQKRGVYLIRGIPNAPIQQEL